MAHAVTQVEWGRVIAHAWLDPAFAHELSLDPAKAVKKFLALDPNSDVEVLEIPPKPGDLSNSQLADVASGKTNLVHFSKFCCC